MRTPPACVYCEEGKGTTSDHIPPRGFFAAKLPQGTEMLTVPCCPTCHSSSQKDDPTLRNLFISLADTEGHPLVDSHLAGKRDRSFEYDSSEMQRLMDLMETAELVTPAGLFVGTAPAFNLDSPLVQRFVERMSRGLLWKAFSIPYFHGNFSFRLNPENFDYSLFPRFGVFKRLFDIFTYGALRGKSNQPHWIIFNLYGNLEFFVRVKELFGNAKEQ